MKPVTLLRGALGCALALLAGCDTRSISNSDYKGNSSYRANHPVGGNSFAYRGELSEFDVLGVAIDPAISEADIMAAITAEDQPRLRRESKILLIQSGAALPDEAMMKAMNERYRATAFSGQPVTQPDGTSVSMSKALRLVAARGGYDKIVCYWGVLESAEKNQITRTVSWTPIVGYVLPDKEQLMRIRLKAVVLDVASGRWRFVTPPPADSSDFASRMTRAQVDQELVAKLKETGYRNLVQSLISSEAG